MTGISLSRRMVRWKSSTKRSQPKGEGRFGWGGLHKCISWIPHIQEACHLRIGMWIRILRLANDIRRWDYPTFDKKWHCRRRDEEIDDCPQLTGCTIDIHSTSHRWSISSARCLFLQKCWLPGCSDAQSSWHPLCVSTTAQTHRCDAPDFAEWSTFATSIAERLRDAIEDHNRSKKRDGQRPRWGAHMTEASCSSNRQHAHNRTIRRDADVAAKAKSYAETQCYSRCKIITICIIRKHKRSCSYAKASSKTSSKGATVERKRRTRNR